MKLTNLQIIIKHRNGGPVFHLKGCLNLSARSQLRDAVETIWDDCHRLCLDLSEVDDVDLSGLSWLMMAESYIRQRGGKFKIVATSPALLRAMALLRPATRQLTCSPGQA